MASPPAMDANGASHTTGGILHGWAQGRWQYRLVYLVVWLHVKLTPETWILTHYNKPI